MGRVFENLSSCTNVEKREGEKASSFAIFSIANVLAFVRWIASPFATRILLDLSVGAKLSRRELYLSSRDFLSAVSCTILTRWVIYSQL